MIDWQRVLLNLRSSGIPVAHVAQEVRLDAYTLDRYARGETRRDLPLTPALRLLNLHQQRCPDRHSKREIGEP